MSSQNIHLMKDAMAEIQADYEQEQRNFAEACEAIAWQLWRDNWKPSLWDRFVMALNQPHSIYRKFDSSDLCRFRYLEHRRKHPFKI